MSRRKELGQYFTPAWSAEGLLKIFFEGKLEGATIIEPTCGDGQFLRAFPQSAHVVGVEFDEEYAEAARLRTGRQVITGRFEEVELPFLDGEVDFIIGNPPYNLKIVDLLLDRARGLLGREGEVGMILPAYTWQTPSRVMRYAEDWRMETHMLPRTLFPGLSVPLAFGLFRKSGPQFVGMALYAEAREVEMLSNEAQVTLKEGRGNGSVWAELLSDAIAAHGGEASLQDIYAYAEGRRPTKTNFWKEQLRKVAQTQFVNVARGRYALPEQMAA